MNYFRIIRDDPSYEPYRGLPEEMSDGIISTDALEYCLEQDVSWIIDQIFWLGAALRVGRCRVLSGAQKAAKWRERELQDC